MTTEEKEYREGVDPGEPVAKEAPAPKVDLMFFVYRTEDGMVQASPDVSKFGIRVAREASIHEMVQMCSDLLLQLNNIRVVNDFALINQKQLRSLHSSLEKHLVKVDPDSV